MAYDLSISNEFVYDGIVESVAQTYNIFNQASNGSIVLKDSRIRGDFWDEPILQYMDVVADRDVDSNEAVSSYAFQGDKYLSPKVNKRLGPVTIRQHEYQKMTANGVDGPEFSMALGKLIGDNKAKAQANSAVAAAVGALVAESANLLYDATGQQTTTLTHTHLVSGMSKKGDQGQTIVCWVMHSKPYYDLVKQTIADKITDVAGATIYSGTPATLGRPTIVIDSSNLISSSNYYTLGLTAGAIEIINSELEDFVFEKVAGNENILRRYQADFAFNCRVNGFKYDAATVSPTDAQLADSSKWTLALASYKNAAGVIIKTA